MQPWIQIAAALGKGKRGWHWLLVHTVSPGWSTVSRACCWQVSSGTVIKGGPDPTSLALQKRQRMGFAGRANNPFPFEGEGKDGDVIKEADACFGWRHNSPHAANARGPSTPILTFPLIMRGKGVPMQSEPKSLPLSKGKARMGMSSKRQTLALAGGTIVPTQQMPEGRRPPS